MFARLTNLYSILVVVTKRLWHNLGLSISALIGMVAVLSIVVCVPIFSHAVSSEVLRQQLNEKVVSTHRRLFSMHLYFLDTRSTSVLNLDKTEAVTNYIFSRIPQLMGLKVEQIVVEIQSGSRNLSPQIEGNASPNTSWKTVRFLLLEPLPTYAKIIDGEWPAPDTGTSGPIQVAVSEQLADEIFINVGDRYTIDNIEIEVTGIWRPINPQDPIWFDNPEAAYADKLWVPEETYRARLTPILNQPVFFASWYVIVGEQTLHYQRSPQYARALIRLDSELRRLLPGIATDYSPLEALQAYEKRADALTTLFYAVGAPMIVLALLFIGLTARIAVQQYEQEIATMRGRGTSWFQIALLNLIESVILVAASLPLSLVGGWFAANVMGKTLSFLKFTSRPAFPFSMDGVNNLWLGIAIFLIVGARFLPSFGLSRSTIIRVKQEQSRGAKKPIWERYYLDFILLIPGIYSYITLRGWAKPAKFLAKLQVSSEQYRDPLLFVAPALFAMAVCMIALRIVPLLVRLLAAVIERLPGVWAYLSMQQIARRPQDHSSALLLIMISLSLSIFSASTAKTLDQWLHDSVYYDTGADLAVHEYIVTGGNTSALAIPGGGGSSTGVTLSDLDAYSAGGAASMEEHLKLPSVKGATRIGRYKGTFSFGVGEMPCLIMGIDRLDFPNVAFFRDDFASQSLGALMNVLGAEPMSVLIPRDLAKEKGFQIGDHIILAVTVLDQRFERDLIVGGTYDYFPTIYPSDTPTLIVNLESIFDNPEDVIGYDVWLKLRERTDIPILLYQLKQMVGGDRAVIDVRGNAIEDVKKGQDQPERVGLFGVLNVGFLTTGLMPGIGFVLYSYASLRRRFIQLGILQAIGLSVKQLIGYLASEQFLLMGLAISSGAAIGLVTCYLFVPFLQVGAAPGTPVPPFQVRIGWNESGWLSLAFGIVLFLTVLGTILYLIRLKVFLAVKMGETL